MAELLASADELVADVAGAAVEAAGLETQSRLQIAGPRAVREAITLRTEGSGADTLVTVHAGGLTPIIVKGARPHRILPRRKRAVAWAGGHPIRAADHPGTRANDFLARAESDVEAGVDDVGEAALDALIVAVDAEVERSING